MRNLGILFFLILILPFVIIEAKPEKKDKGKAGPPKTSQAAVSVSVEISSAEKKIIQDYFREESGKKKKNIPRGLQKKVARGGELPPGWEKKIAKGEILPEDIYKTAEPLPEALTKKLAEGLKDTVLVKIEDKIVRLSKATKEVLDVFEIDF